MEDEPGMGISCIGTCLDYIYFVIALKKNPYLLGELLLWDLTVVPFFILYDFTLTFFLPLW